MQSVSSCEGNVTTHGVEDESRVETRQRAISSPDCSPRQAPAGQTGAGKYVRLKKVGRVAQVVEQRPFKACVGVPTPTAPTNLSPKSTGPLREGFPILSPSPPRRYSAPSR